VFFLGFSGSNSLGTDGLVEEALRSGGCPRGIWPRPFSGSGGIFPPPSRKDSSSLRVPGTSGCGSTFSPPPGGCPCPAPTVSPSPCPTISELVGLFCGRVASSPLSSPEFGGEYSFSPLIFLGPLCFILSYHGRFFLSLFPGRRRTSSFLRR